MKNIWLIVLVLLAVLSGCSYWGPCIDGTGPLLDENRETGAFTAITNTGSFDVYVNQADSFSVVVRAQENLIPIIETNVVGSRLIVETRSNTCYRSSLPVEVHLTLPETHALTLNGSGRIFAGRVSSTEVEIFNSGSGSIKIDSTLSEWLVLDNSGSGHIEVNASYADMVDLIQSGSGAILNDNVIGSDQVDIRHSSSGNIAVAILDVAELDVILSGSGRIELSGYGELAAYTLNSSGRIDAFDMEQSEVVATNSGSGNIFLWANDLLNATITGSGDIVYIGDPVITSRITGSGKLRAY